MMKHILIIVGFAFIPYFGISQQNVRYFKNINIDKTAGNDSLSEEAAKNTNCYRITYNENNKPLKIEYLKNFKLSENNGIALYIWKYDNKGNPVERSCYGIDNKLKEGTNGIAITRWKYDDKGNKTEKSCYGADEKLKEGKYSEIAISRYKYDEKGTMTEESCYGADEKLKGDSYTGAAIYRFKYNDKGEQEEISYYGTDETLKKIEKIGN